MRTKQFELINGDCKAIVSVRTEDGFAVIDRMTAEVSLGVYDTNEQGELKISSREWNKRKQFAAAWSQSSVDGLLGFEWCDSPFDAEAMEACYQGWGRLPGDMVMQWLNAVNMVDTTPNDPDLVPPNKLDKQKKTTPE